MKIIRYEESVYYANVENFKYKIMKMCGINPDLIIAKLKKEQERDKKNVERLRRLEKNSKNVGKNYFVSFCEEIIFRASDIFFVK
jgi:hypothetical protein